MLRRGYDVKIGKINDLEVDFICTKYEEKIYIQVAYLLASEEPIEREFSVLELIKDNFPKYVISMDQFDMSRNGIKHYNIIDFLLGELFFYKDYANSKIFLLIFSFLYYNIY